MQPLPPVAVPAMVEQLLDRYGLVALLLIFVLEGAMLLYFAPSESLVPAALLLLTDGALVASAAVVAVAVLGATLGQFALFALAKRGGREYLLDRRWFRVSEAHLDRFEGWFARWGSPAVALANALPFTRGMLTVPAGLAAMDGRRFLVYSTLGTLVFETLLAALTVGLLRLRWFDAWADGVLGTAALSLAAP
ncbi:hypothetical protein BRC90_05200 [Halobacteriales archaeon QS_4_69_34]|nr:MAG: hypothetical protein BRC90_05200 [Halobacteriales archaeon QS_4_69_34]